MKDKWSGLGVFYKTSVFLILLALLTMILGLILIATAKYSILGVDQNGFDFIKQSSISYVLKNSSAPLLTFSSSAWMQLQWGVGLAVIAAPILFGLVIISILLGFFAIGSEKTK